MAFTTKDWRDSSQGPPTTPLSAAALEDMEARLGAYTDDQVAAGGGGGTSEAVFLTDVGCVGNGTTNDTVALQAALNAFRTDQRWVDGLGKTYAITGPVVLPPNIKLRHLILKAVTGWAPTGDDDAMVYSSQGLTLPLTANAGTDVLTATAHAIPADDVKVVFIGTSLPAPLVSGRLYYARDRTTNTFKVSATPGGGAVDITSAGSGTMTVYTEVASLEKVYIDDVMLNGNSLAKTGAIFSLQQQSYLTKFRIDDCTYCGLHLGGQQAVFHNFESIDCETALWLDSALFMYFYGTNLEGCVYGVYVGPGDIGWTGEANSCGFFGIHLEQNNDAVASAISLNAQHDQLTFENVSVSMNTNGAIVLYQGAGSVSNSGYTLRNVRVVAGGAANRPTMIDDDDRGLLLDSWDDFRFRLEEFHAPAKPTNPAFTDPGPLTTALPAGGYIRSGSTTLSQSKLAVKADTSQTGDLTTWRNAAGTDVSGVDKDGFLYTTGPLSAASYPVELRPDRAYKVGEYYPCSDTPHGGLGGAGSMTVSRAHFSPFIVYAQTTFDRIACYTTVVGSAGSVTRLGIYNDNASGLPGTVLLDAGTVATDSGTGIKAITISQVLAPGRYWAVCVPQTASPTYRRTITGSRGVFLNTDWSGTGMYFDGVTGALGATPTLSSASINPPLVGIRAA